MILSIKDIVLLAEGIACITGLVAYRKNPLKLFSWYLLAVFVTELTGRYLRFNSDRDTQLLFYTFFATPLQFILLFTVFTLYFKGTRYRYAPWLCLGAYLCMIPVEIVFLTKGKNVFYSASYSAANLGFLTLIVLYFLQLMRSTDILYFRDNMMFYICLGLLIYNLGSFPFWALLNYLVDHYNDFALSYYRFTQLLNCCTYLIFTAGFIWIKPKSSYSSL